jgi:predicted RNA-binding protein YlqC (UPF0109 family)
MSAFDDEFGLFGEEAPREDEERRPALGARRIAAGEKIIDDVELENGAPYRRRTERGNERPQRGRRRERGRAAPDPAASSRRAAELLYFLAQKLVSKPEAVAVQTVPSERGPILELEVDHEDIGKVVGRAGRVAQALRTLVRASAEGKIGVEIIEVEEVDEDESEVEGAAAADLSDA